MYVKFRHRQTLERRAWKEQLVSWKNALSLSLSLSVDVYLHIYVQTYYEYYTRCRREHKYNNVCSVCVCVCARVCVCVWESVYLCVWKRKFGRVCASLALILSLSFSLSLSACDVCVFANALACVCERVCAYIHTYIPVSVSKATTSESITKDSVPSLITPGIIVIRSGYFVVLSSEFRLKILIEPSLSKCTCEKIWRGNMMCVYQWKHGEQSHVQIHKARIVYMCMYIYI